MTLLRRKLFEVKTWLSNLSKYLLTDNPGKEFNKEARMTARQLEDETDSFPNKKICVEGNDRNNGEIEEKTRKRNVAMLLAYCGTNYWGMQRNPNYKTIESELLSALHRANFIPTNALEETYMLHFQRAARTDKGVSAAKQVVSFKIAENYNVESINSYLPEDIKVLSIKRVTKGFNCKNECTARTYSYTLPTFALAPELHEEYPKNFRISDELINKTNEILKTFLGTRCFHNFTSKRDSQDPSAKRYIMSFEIGQPFTDGEEFITLTVRGQSFMLHQIRKMVGHTIAILKGVVPPHLVPNVWDRKKYSIPMAPGLGLVLENLHYDRYNRKYGKDGIHEPLDWDELADEVEKFKRNYILPNIIRKEVDEKSMFNWTQTLRIHKYELDTEKEEIQHGEKEPQNEKELIKTEIQL